MAPQEVRARYELRNQTSAEPWYYDTTVFRYRNYRHG